MVVKTADGWKSKSHYKSQGALGSEANGATRSLLTHLALRAEKAWRKARAKLQEMVGEECMSSKAKLSEKAENIFKSIDTDNSGGLDVPELKACFEKAGVELTQSEAQAMVSGAARRSPAHNHVPLAMPRTLSLTVIDGATGMGRSTYGSSRSCWTRR